MLRSGFVFALSLLLGLLVAPAQAQTGDFDFCTIFQETPDTEGVESALFEDWNPNTTDWDADERWILTYQNGNPTEIRFQQRTQAGAWADSSRSLATFDATDRLTECTFQSTANGSFVNTFRTSRSYNAGGQLDVVVVQNWDTTAANPNGTWVNSQRSTHAYDGNGNRTQRVDELWDDNSQTWENFLRERSTYDGSDRLTERTTELSDGSGGWLNNERTLNTYGPNGLTETTEQTWDLFTQAWQNDRRTQFSSPAADTRVEVDQLWTGAAWENEERRTATLDANDRPETEVVEVWTGITWVNTDRTENSFATIDGSLKLEQTLEQTWDSNAGAWVNDSRTTLSYSGVIPVELASFRAWSTDTHALLRWQTTSETNNAGFEVHHRPADAPSWQPLGFVESNVTGGTTADPQSYRFRTAPLTPGRHHFRLRQVDLDGTATLTDPVSVTVRMADRLRLTPPSPHPVSGRATVAFAVNGEADAEVALYNLLGQRVMVLHEGPAAPDREHTISFDAQGLASGRYILRLRVGTDVRTHPITVVR